MTGTAGARTVTYTPDCVVDVESALPDVNTALAWNGTQYLPVTELSPGYGYFLISDSASFEPDVDCPLALESTGYTVSLHTGWNLIGIPESAAAKLPTLFDEMPDTDDAYVIDFEHMKLVSRGDASGTEQGVYWVYADSPATITIAAVSGATGTGEYILIPAVAQDISDPAHFTITLSAVLNPETGEPVRGLTKKDFSVSVGGMIEPVTSVTPIIGAESYTDIVFIMDITGSMAGEIRGVAQSVTEFADFLESTGQDVRLGTVTFGDKVETTFALTDNVASFKSFFSNLEDNMVYGCDTPENPLDAMAYAINNFDFRSQAQKIFILITDANMHRQGDLSGLRIDDDYTGGSLKQHEQCDAYFPYYETYYPHMIIDKGATFNHTTDDIVAMVRNKYVVHVVSNTYYYYSDINTDPATLARQSGGTSLALNGGTVDLTTLPIKEIISSGYIINYDATESTTAGRSAGRGTGERILRLNIGGVEAEAPF